MQFLHDKMLICEIGPLRALNGRRRKDREEEDTSTYPKLRPVVYRSMRLVLQVSKLFSCQGFVEVAQFRCREVVSVGCRVLEN